MRIASLLTLAVVFPAIAYASLINLNTASVALLDTLPGIGPSKATAIITYRTQHGPFAKIEDIQNVKGIGPVTFANLKERITVDVQPSLPPKSLNTVQAVKPAPPITNPKTNIQQHDETVIAPTAEVEPAAVGAVATELPKKTNSLLTSPWTLGLLGVIVLAGGAFIFL